jgi:hypothetical protein
VVVVVVVVVEDGEGIILGATDDVMVVVGSVTAVFAEIIDAAVPCNGRLRLCEDTLVCP